MDFTENIFNDALNDRCSFVAYDIQSNQVVGVWLNEIRPKDDTHIINEPNEKLDFILQFLDHVHENINLFKYFRTDSRLHIFIINVDGYYRGRGLASSPLSASIEYAKEFNVGGVYAKATNIYSVNSLQRQGFQIYH